MLGTEGGKVIPVACNFSEYPHISNPSGFVALLQRALLTATKLCYTFLMHASMHQGIKLLQTNTLKTFLNK